MRRVKISRHDRQKTIKKMRDRAGETIAETLVALLIAALALVMLAGAVSAGKNIVEKSRDKMSSYYAVSNQMVRMDSSGDGTDTITATAGDTTVFQVNVTTWKNEELKKPVITYRIKDQ